MDLERARAAKVAGNDLFRRGEFNDAIQRYTEALATCPQGHSEVSVYLKNRSACWLKLENYEKALADATAALEISPGDVKALFRRAQALEATGELANAFRDTKSLLSIEPRNKEAMELASRLSVALRRKAATLQSTDAVVEEMLQALSRMDLSVERKIQAAKNCAILSQENVGADKIFQAGAVTHLLPLLDSSSPELVGHLLQVYTGMCSGHQSRVCAVIQGLTLDKLSALITSPQTKVCAGAVAIAKQAILALSADGEKPLHGSDISGVMAPQTLLISLLQALFLILTNTEVLVDTRNHIIELLIVTAPQNNLGEVFLHEGLVSKLLDLATVNQSESSGEGYRMKIAVVLSKLLESFGKRQPLREAFMRECATFVNCHLAKNDPEYRTQGLRALVTLLQGAVAIGNTILGEAAVLKMIVDIASSDDPNSQIIAAEALALSASDKERCHGIMVQGLPVLKRLFSSSDDRVRVRALVGLCKIGSVGGSNVNARTLAEGSTIKLAKSCRKFIVGARTQDSVRWWAVEGLAFLSLDAEVKEALIHDQAALKTLIDTCCSADQTLLYGLATIFVNLSNSYDKPECNPELEELGRYAGENVPKEHEFDAADYIQKRVAVLLEMDVVPALVSICTNCDSERVHEQVARVFLALVDKVSHRGAVVQRAGSCLLSLARTNSEKGKLVAAQALAKITITNNPRLTFPGQRSLELVRPLILLLKAEKGLLNFEGLMALTNLASLSEEHRRHILREGGVQHMESLMFEEHDLIRRAATEALCNMVSLEEVHNRFYSEDTERVKLWTLFAGEEDEKLALAAAGGLAQLSHDPKICKMILQVKSALNIFKELLGSANADLQHRSMYILANLVEAGPEFAEKIIDEFLDIFMAFTKADGVSAAVKEAAVHALEKAVDYGLIKPNPDLAQ